MIKEAIIKVAKKEDLTYEESKAVMNEIMDGETSQVQTAAYLTALAMKGETIYARALCSSPARYGCPGDCRYRWGRFQFF